MVYSALLIDLKPVIHDRKYCNFVGIITAIAAHQIQLINPKRYNKIIFVG
ncbi:MAG: hypothetical protein KME57_29195 [Scytonema hyalinum WJT4-NPBG1]|nr:hypothetical protein [Scytonema hyalinum WJT4-NPBG1]